MEITKNTYLQFIDFFDVSNWSVQYLKGTAFSYNKNFELVKIGDFLIKNNDLADIIDEVEYKRVTVRMNNKGVTLRDTELGKNIGTKRQFVVQGGEFIMSKIDARNGAFGIIPQELQGAIVTNDFPTFHINTQKLNPDFFVFLTSTDEFLGFAQTCSSGTTGRQRINMDQLLNVKIPLPSLEAQDKIVQAYNLKLQNAQSAESESIELESQIEKYLMKELGIETEISKEFGGLRIIEYKNFDRWDSKGSIFMKSDFEVYRIRDLITSIGTGTTPPTGQKKYFDQGDVNFYTPADLTDNIFLENSTRKVTKLAINERKARKFEKGTILFVGIGSTVGKVGIVNNIFAASNQQITGLFFNQDKVNNLFAYYFFDRFIDITTKEKTVSTIPIVNQEKILNIPFPLPPLEIQDRIVAHITGLKDEIKRLKVLASTLREQAKVEFEGEIFS